MQKRINFSTLSHNELIHYMAEHNGDNAAWQEFLSRFQNFIAAVIINECKRLNLSDGSDKIGDLLHTVYLRLLMNDSKALKNYEGRYENSIVRYLKLIAINVVRSNKNAASKGRFKDLEENDESLASIIPDNSFQDKIDEEELKDVIEQALQEIESMRRNGGRDVLIFRYYFYEEFDVEAITALPEFAGMSQKRIANIIAEIKAELRDCLVHEGY